MFSVLFFKELIICICLLLGGLTDCFHGRVANRLLFTVFLFICPIRILYEPELILSSLCLGLLVIILLFPLFKRRLLGAADIKLFSLILFTFPSFVGLEIIFLSLLLSSFYMIFKLLKGKGSLKAAGAIKIRLFTQRGLRHKSDGGRSLVALTPFMLFGALLRFILL